MELVHRAGLIDLEVSETAQGFVAEERVHAIHAGRAGDEVGEPVGVQVAKGPESP
jgi:hypothetical protein